MYEFLEGGFVWTGRDERGWEEGGRIDLLTGFDSYCECKWRRILMNGDKGSCSRHYVGTEESRGRKGRMGGRADSFGKVRIV